MIEFEEIKKVWDSQSNQQMYVINEQALHGRVMSKKSSSLHIANVSELMGIMAYAGASIFIFAINTSAAMYALATWMMISAVYVAIGRYRRLRDDRNFGSSLMDDLNHAISVATYQVRISGLMRWNIVPIGLLIVVGLWSGGKSAGVVLGIIAFLALTGYLSGWEHRIYEVRRRELVGLREKLKAS